MHCTIARRFFIAGLTLQIAPCILLSIRESSVDFLTNTDTGVLRLAVLVAEDIGFNCAGASTVPWRS